MIVLFTVYNQSNNILGLFSLNTTERERDQDIAKIFIRIRSSLKDIYYVIPDGENFKIIYYK